MSEEQAEGFVVEGDVPVGVRFGDAKVPTVRDGAGRAGRMGAGNSNVRVRRPCFRDEQQLGEEVGASVV
jgi:hypothetical protein